MNHLRPWWQLSGFTRTRGTDRFWRKVHKTSAPQACWTWRNGRSGAGYGVIRWQGRLRYAHNLAWELYHGRPIPAGRIVRHHCDNPLCCRPSHLAIGTPADNSRDMVAHGRQRTGVLSHDQVRAIRAAVAQRVRNVDIAAQHQVTQRTIWLIASRHTYRHVPDAAPIP